MPTKGSRCSGGGGGIVAHIKTCFHEQGLRHVHALTGILTKMKSMIKLALFSAGDGFHLCLLYIIHFSLHYTFYCWFYGERICGQAVYPYFSV